MNKNIILGIDIGGTKISAAPVESNSIIDDPISFFTPKTSEEILYAVISEVKPFMEEYSIKAIGIATAGTVNKENSKVIGSTGNLPAGYADLDFKKTFEEAFNIPVIIENDANAAAYSEFIAGNAIGHLNTITITIGTGVGGGIIVNGRILRGKSGAGAEVGHIIIAIENQRPCTCGNFGCWEAYASGTGYAVTAREIAQQIPYESREGLLKGNQILNLTTHDVISGVKANDKFAITVHEIWHKHVIAGLISLANIFDPESIVLSGGMAKFINYEKINKELNNIIVVSNTLILPAKFDNNAGILGAAFLAREKFF